MTDLTASRERNQKATVALVLGSIAFACVLLLALLAASGLADRAAAWFVLPLVTLGCGVPAVFVGPAAWVDARQGVSGRGLREAQIGTILGGIAVAAMLLAGILLLGFLIVFMLSNPEG